MIAQKTTAASETIDHTKNQEKESAEKQLARIATIVKRAVRSPQGQECWELRKDGGCTECGGFGTVEDFACGNRCRHTDHGHCGTTSVPCGLCGGTGLGVVELFRLLKRIGRIVGVDVKLPNKQYLKG